MSAFARQVGQWWIPHDPDRRVGGILDGQHPDGLTLHLTDHLIDHQAQQIPVLFGEARGREVTLFDLRPASGGSITCGQVRTETQVMRARVALVGIHLLDATDAVFTGEHVAMTGLTAWAAGRALRWTYEQAPPPSEETVLLTEQPTRRLRAVVDDGNITVELGWNVAIPGERDEADFRRYEFKERMMVHVEVTSARPWDGFHAPVRAIRELVTIGTQTPARITERTLLIPQVDGPSWRVDVFHIGVDDATGTEAAADDSESIFTLADIDFATVFPQWWELRKKLGLSVHLLLGLDYKKDVYYEHRVFTAASAAEGFHAALFYGSNAGTDLDPAAHATLKERLTLVLAGVGAEELQHLETALAGIAAPLKTKILQVAQGLSPEESDWVKKKTSDNRAGLPTRYRQLATAADPTAVQVLLTDIDTWAKWLTKARNSIGHANTGKFEAGVPESARYFLEYVTRALLHLIVLDQLGIDADRQRAVVQQRWLHVARKFREAIESEKNTTPHG